MGKEIETAGKPARRQIWQSRDHAARLDTHHQFERGDLTIPQPSSQDLARSILISPP